MTPTDRIRPPPRPDPDEVVSAPALGYGWPAVRRSILGHVWTVGPHLAHALRPTALPRDEAWDATILDPIVGAVRLTGWLRARPDSDTLLVLIHGLGGNVGSRYVVRTAKAADDAALSYLRLNLRGADRSGEDLYHAGLTDDLRVALASPALARFARVHVIGFSMGGHVALKWAAEPGRDPRVRSVVAVCAPLDLEFGARSIQRPLGRPYQWHVLRGLKAMHRAARVRMRPGVPPVDASEIRTIVEWDEVVIVPRFGFRSRQAYYEQHSAGPLLGGLDLPTLFVAAEADPMVTASQLRPWLEQASPAVEVAWTERGGHVGFPDDLDLGLGDVGPLEPQIVRWVLRHR